MTKELRPVLLLLVLVGLAYAWREEGRRQGRDEERQNTSARLMLVQRAVTDSLFAQHTRQLDSAERERLRILKQRDAAVHSARARTDGQINTSRTIGYGVSPADDESKDALRRRFVAQLDSIDAALAIERAAEDSAKLARDSLHAEELRLVRRQLHAIADTLKAERKTTDAAISAAIKANRPSFVKQWGERVLWATAGYGLARLTSK